MKNKKHKQYLLGGLAFLLLVLVFDRGLFFLMRRLEAGTYKKQSLKQVFFQRRDFNKQFLELPKGTYNTLIMGSSRTHRGIHPFYFYKRLKQKAFKIAKAKIRLKFNYYFYIQYKKHAGIPKVVIYGLDYFIFKLKSHKFFMEAVTGEKPEPEPYKDGPLLLVSNKTDLNTFIDNYLERFNNDLEATIEHGSEKPAFKLIDPFIGYRKTDPALLKRHKGNRFKHYSYRPYPGEEGVYFTKLLEEWENDGVTVILVFLPDYIGTYRSNHQLDRFKANIRELTGGYKNVFIYDYNRTDKFDLENPAYFLDGGYGKTNSHLSLTGARVFNRMLLRDIRDHYRR